MPEWLLTSFPGDGEVSASLLACRLAVAFVLGCGIGGVYRLTHGRGGQSPGLLATLVLLTVLIAMVTLAIGNSVARAFSLVGALAIVRFRTVVEDTRDTAFVIFAVSVGMSAGAGLLTIPLVGMPFVCLAAFLFRPHGATAACTLRVRVGVGPSPDDLLRGTFARHLERLRLLNVSTARQGGAFDLVYEGNLRNPESAMALVVELNGLPGVQEVDLRQAGS